MITEAHCGFRYLHFDVFQSPNYARAGSMHPALDFLVYRNMLLYSRVRLAHLSTAQQSKKG